MADHLCIMSYHQIYCYAIALVVCISQVAYAENRDSPEIVFGLIVGDKRSNGARVNVENAIDEVNKRSDLLSRNRLNFIPLSVDSEVILNHYYKLRLCGSVTHNVFRVMNAVRHPFLLTYSSKSPTRLNIEWWP